MPCPTAGRKGLEAPALALGLSPDGVSFEAVKRKAVARSSPARLAAKTVPEDGLRLLAAIASLTRTSRTLASKLLKAPTPADVLKTLRAEEEKGRG